MNFGPQRPAHRPWCTIRALLVALAATLVVLPLPTGRFALADQSETRHEPAGLAVTATKATTACFSDNLVLNGTVTPRREVLVRPDQEDLRIKEILAEPGQQVLAAQILARLSPTNDDQQSSIVSIRAPVAGMVIGAPSLVGEMTSAKGEPLFRIVADCELDLALDVPANQAARVAAGQQANIKFVGMDEVTGQVRLVLTTIDAVTQLGQVRISLGRNPSLRIGVFGRATIELDKSCGVVVPLSALLFGPDGAVVQIIRDNRIETRRVTVGVAAKNNVLIREGIAEGDLIVARAGAFLREGDRVRPVVSGD
jgi:HlyD family secretion protein